MMRYLTLSEERDVDVVNIDFSEAFDVISLSILTIKLVKYVLTRWTISNKVDGHFF